MAIALIGGLITSTILTLVSLPALYEIAAGAYARGREAWMRRNAASDPDSTASVSAGD